MSIHTKARKNLEYVDPATFTPQFAWKKNKSGSSRQVYCEGVALERIAKDFGTPAYVYSRTSDRIST